METQATNSEEQNSEAGTDKAYGQAEGINRVVKDAQEDLIDNMPDSHPEPKPDLK